MNKKFLLISTLLISGSIFSKPSSPLAGDASMNLINFGLEKSDNAGKFVEDIKCSGECARSILKELSSFRAKKKDRVALVEMYKKLSNSHSQGSDVNLDSDKLELEVIDLLKKQLLDPRKDFLVVLHDYAPLIRGPLKTSLSKSKLGDKNSLLLAFMDVKPTEAEAHFYKTIKDEKELKQACSEFVVFCRDLWGALSPELMQKRHAWLTKNKAS